MKKKIFYIAIGALLSLFSVRVEAQQPARKVPRIGILRAAASFAGRFEAFRQGLRDLGYVEGKTIRIEYRWAEGKLGRLTALAAGLVWLNAEVLGSARGNSTTRAPR